MADSPQSKSMNFAGLAVAMTMGALGIVSINLYSDRAFVEESLLKRARAHHDDIVLMRRWVADYGGVYVEKKPGVESSRFLNAPDLNTTDGRVLTLRDPGQMTHEIAAYTRERGDYVSHITSLRPKNPKNIADPWEAESLRRFAQGEKEVFDRIKEKFNENGKDKERTMFRYMAPLLIEAPCLKCHVEGEYKVGDVRGGISITFDVSETEAVFLDNAIATGVAVLLILFGVGQLMALSLQRVRVSGREADRQRERFESLVQSADGIVWEADPVNRHYGFVSNQAEVMFGYPLSDWMSPGFWAAHVHPEDRERVRAYSAGQNSARQAHDIEYRFIAQDGRCVWLHELVSVVVENGQPAMLRGLSIDVTQRKESELLTQKVQAEQTAILNNALVGIVYLRQRMVVTCNPRFEQIFGYEAGALAGCSTECLYPSKEAFESVGEAGYASIGRGESFNVETLLRRQDGRVFWGAVTGRAIDPAHPQEGSIWIYADISERKQAAEEANKLRRAVEQSPVSIVITDASGVIEYVNPRFCEVTGYTRAEAIGQNPRILKSGQTPDDTYADLWKSIMLGEEWRGVLSNRRKNGDIFWEDASIAPIYNDQAEITHFIAVKEDITERMKVERELQHYRDDLESEVRSRTQDLVLAMQKATAADRAKSEFLTNMSHEMRTPLNAVIGFCGLAKRTDLSVQQRDYLEKIDGAGQHLLELINNLLDLSKIAAGRIELFEVAFDPQTLMARLSAVFSYKAEEKGIELEIRLDPAVPTQLIGDSLRLNQVLLNLLANAIKFTERGQVTLEVRHVASSVDQVRLSFVITDTGIGMDANELARAFQPFAQADASITRKYGGTGLGLVISRELVGLMGGQLTAESEKGRGSRFVFEIDFHTGSASDGLVESDSSNPARIEPSPSSEGARDYRFSNVRVLLVEDQPLNRQVAEELLAAVGVVVESAVNGQQAIDLLLSRDPQAFDLVLMDLQMPVLDGLSAMRVLRARPEFKNLPIIALTAHVLDEERLRSTAAGANDHLGKPFHPDQLYAAVARWVPESKLEKLRPGADEDKRLDASLSVRAHALFGEATPALDWAVALERFDNRLDKYVGWLERFVNEKAALVDELSALLAQNRPADAASKAHSLKGLSGTLGLGDVYRATQQLEKLLRDPESQGINEAVLAEHLANLARTMSEATRRVRAAAASHGGAVPPAKALKASDLDAQAEEACSPQLDTQLDALQRMLDCGDGDSGEWAEGCMAQMRGHRLESAMRRIVEAVVQFDFSDASRKLQALRTELVTVAVESANGERDAEARR